MEDFDVVDTTSHLELYRMYADEELSKGNDIVTFSEFRELMNS